MVKVEFGNRMVHFSRIRKGLVRQVKDSGDMDSPLKN